MNYKYTLSIHTGNERFAGTDSNIFVVLYGVLGTSLEYHLNALSNNGNAFERDQWDTCVVNVGDKNLGDIYKIRIRSDCAYGGSDWLLDCIDVTSPSTHKVRFLYSSWITDKGNKELSNSDMKINCISQSKEINIYSDAEFCVPENVTIEIADTINEKVGYHLSETTLVEIGTNTSYEMETTSAPFKETVAFALSTKNVSTKQEDISNETIKTFSQKMIVKSASKTRYFKAVYIKQIEDNLITMGNLTISIPATLSIKPGGFIEI
ncbi:MAG: PLAT/LH2 domain-containing protein [Erysipelothrix sp.]